MLYLTLSNIYIRKHLLVGRNTIDEYLVSKAHLWNVVSASIKDVFLDPKKTNADKQF